MKERFHTDDWTWLVFLPFDLFEFVARIDEEVDDAEIATFRAQLADGPRLSDPLHREVMQELARVAASVDSGPRWIESLREEADRRRAEGRRRGGVTGITIMMPTGGVVSAPAGFDAAKEILTATLDGDEYESFVASVLVGGVEIAKASGGEGPASISTEENVALQAFGQWLGVRPDAIERRFGEGATHYYRPEASVPSHEAESGAPTDGTIMTWLGEHHPELTSELLMGVVEHDNTRMEAMRSPKKLEKWLKHHHRHEFAEWKTASHAH